jgi:ribosomal protein S18 acetylase RimI-like enzyme
MLIRSANFADAQEIARVHSETWRTVYRGQISDDILDMQNMERRTALWQRRLAQLAEPVFLAEEGGVLGFCELIPSRDPGAGQTVGEIAAIYVHPSHWRKGVGRALCAHALSAADRRGYELVTLWVLASNDGAKHFYQAMGFRPDGARKTERLADGCDLHEVRFRRQALVG